MGSAIYINATLYVKYTYFIYRYIDTKIYRYIDIVILHATDPNIIQ